jgi:hypothetical protein
VIWPQAFADSPGSHTVDQCHSIHEPVREPGSDEVEITSELGAGERIRTADLPFTRSVLTGSARASCTDDTGNRTDGTSCAGIILRVVPRTVPRERRARVHGRNRAYWAVAAATAPRFVMVRQDSRSGQSIRSLHCRIGPHLDSRRRRTRRRWPGVSGGLCLGRPARRTPGRISQARRSDGLNDTDQGGAGPSSSLSIVQLAATASRVALRAVARDRLRRPWDPPTTHYGFGGCDEDGADQGSWSTLAPHDRAAWKPLGMARVLAGRFIYQRLRSAQADMPPVTSL